MAADLARSALAANRDVPDDAPGPFQDCRTEVHIMLFFDGTGNNKRRFENSEATMMSKWSSSIGVRHVDSRATNTA